MSREANRRQLADWLTDRYEVETAPDGSIRDALGRCALCLVDSRTARQHREALAAARDAAEPVFLPVLVLLTGSGQGAEAHWAVADDVVETPVKQAVLRHRIGVLLQARQYSLDLKRRNDRLERFAGIVTHDLRNPLSIAQGYLDAARETGDAESFDRVERALERMAAIIDDVLAMARLGRASGNRQPVRLADAVDEAWAGVETDEATLTVEFDRSFSVEAHESHLIELFENLFRNAIEHGGSDVAVTVGALDGGDAVFVEDDGPGIPVENRDDVFEYGQSTDEAGAGFGLTIVRTISEAHDWSVRVTDGRTGGARFEISFGGGPDRNPAEPVTGNSSG